MDTWSDGLEPLRESLGTKEVEAVNKFKYLGYNVFAEDDMKEKLNGDVLAKHLYSEYKNESYFVIKVQGSD